MNTVPVFPNNANNSLFVGDLSKFCTEANLENLFAQFGQILDVKIKRNNTTGKTLSYGFVYFANDDCAARAMEKLNNVPFFGRNLRIRWAIHNAKAQKAPEESVINSVYVRFITPKVNEYITEEAFHKVFDHFGCVVDVSIKESSVDQRTNRQSGYGFVHFSADNAGISAAFQAVSAVDNATIDGVTYNVELSKNLLKQFNEMNRAGGVGATGSTSSHASANSSPMPVYSNNNMGMMNGNAYGQSPHGMSPHGQSPHGTPAPWPTQANNALYGQNNNNMNSRMSPSTAARPGFPTNSPGGYGNQQYSMQQQQQQQQQQLYQQQGHLSPMQQQQQQQQQMQMQMQMQQRYSPQAYSPPPGQIMGLNNNNLHNNNNNNNNMHNTMNNNMTYQQQPDLGLGNFQRRTNAQPITSLLNDANLQSMYRPDSHTNNAYANTYESAQPQQPQPSNQHLPQQQQQHTRYLGTEPQPFDGSAGTGFYKTQQPSQLPLSGFDPFQDADQFFGEQECEKSHLSHASGGAHSSTASRSSPHCLSPLPGKSRHGSEDFTPPGANNAATAPLGASNQAAHHVRQGSNGSHLSHLSHTSHNSALFSQQHNLPNPSGLDGGMLHNTEQAVQSATYSPLSNGAVSPMYDSDGNHSRYGAKQPPPLNLNAIGGSSASSVRSVPSAPSGSGSTSPVPIGRTPKLNLSSTAGGVGYWENTESASGSLSARGDKPPTPRGGRTISRQNSHHGGVPLPGQLNLNLNANMFAQEASGNNPASPTNSAGVAAGHHYGQQLNAGLAQGITPSLPPSGLFGRPGLQSRSSSTSSATTSTLGVFSGTVSPIPGQYGTGASLAANAARKAAQVPDLEMYGVNRSMSSGGSDRNMPALSTMGTTDSESGFFRSHSSLRADSGSTAPSASGSMVGGSLLAGEHAHREQQALLASHIMLQGISLPNRMADESLEPRPQGYDFQGLGHNLLGQNWQGQGQGQSQSPGQRENFHRDYFVDPKSAEGSTSGVATVSEPASAVPRPTRLTSAMKQLSMQSVSTIGEDGVEDDNLEDEFTYSSASLSPKHSSSSLNLSSRDSFRMDTSFLLSPQSSTQSLECSPYNAPDSARGRPPSGSTPSATTSIYPPNATAPNLLRRAFLLDVAAGSRDSGSSGSSGSQVDDIAETNKDGRPLSLTSVTSTDSRRVSMSSLASNDSSHLAGIAIASSSSSGSVDHYETRSEHGTTLSPAHTNTHNNNSVPLENRRRSSRPEGVRLSQGKTSIADVAAESPDAQKGKKQLSLMQFFKPVVRTSSAEEN